MTVTASPLIGFSPDADISTPGIMLDVVNTYPSEVGYKPVRSFVASSMAVLSGACLGAASIRLLNDTTVSYAATATKIYKATSTTWTDVSAATYTAADSWRFSVLGNYVYASSKSNTLQYSTGANFADTPTAPKARLIKANAGFLMLADTDSATYGDQSDRWWCSAFNDGQSWTPSATTQATTGRLVDAPGPIRALETLADGFVAYKDQALFVARYVGSPSVWQWNMVSNDIGCISPDGVVNTGTMHLFVGANDFYAFDGVRPTPIGMGIRNWFFARLDNGWKTKIKTLHDRVNGLVYWFYPSTDSGGALNNAVIYNYRRGKWGHVAQPIEVAVEFISAGITIDGLGALYATIDSIPAIPFDSPYWSATSVTPSVFNTSHQIGSMSGAAMNSGFTMTDVGDDVAYSMLSGVKLRFVRSPTTATASCSFKSNSGDAYTAGDTVSMTDGAFMFHRSARWHRVSFSFTGDCETTGFGHELIPDGVR